MTREERRCGSGVGVAVVLFMVLWRETGRSEEQTIALEIAMIGFRYTAGASPPRSKACNG